MKNTMNKSEWIELEALRAVYESTPDQLKQTLGLKFENIDGVICSASSIEPSILINRCFVSHQALLKNKSIIKAVKQFYINAGVGKFFMHVSNTDPETKVILEHSGMKKSRGWMKFTRNISTATIQNSALTIHKISSEHAKDFARIVVPCFDMDKVSIPLVANIINHPHWHLFMGFDGDTPAATGAVFYKNGSAYCDWGATHIDFRCRGFQGAVLAHRINSAIKMGASNIYTVTGEDVPGDPQHSYKNIMRYGFTENYLRENWVPA